MLFRYEFNDDTVEYLNYFKTTIFFYNKYLQRYVSLQIKVFFNISCGKNTKEAPASFNFIFCNNRCHRHHSSFVKQNFFLLYVRSSRKRPKQEKRNFI